MWATDLKLLNLRSKTAIQMQFIGEFVQKRSKHELEEVLIQNPATPTTSSDANIK